MCSKDGGAAVRSKDGGAAVKSKEGGAAVRSKEGGAAVRSREGPEPDEVGAVFKSNKIGYIDDTIQNLWVHDDTTYLAPLKMIE